jgi:poly-beta-1,6-N-acetyl-D-glucosamine biosynthesis protein PgaD
MNSSDRPWPPLIVAEHVPRLVKWRDVLLTLTMWGFFAVLLDKEFEFLMGHSLGLLGLAHLGKDADWPMSFEVLLPFFLLASVLAASLIIFSLRTVRRRRLGLLLPQPAPLAVAVQARRAGLDEAALIAARGRRIVIVRIDADGRHRIEAPHG